MLRLRIASAEQGRAGIYFFIHRQRRFMSSTLFRFQQLKKVNNLPAAQVLWQAGKSRR